jgi:lauroyl/myristoyl acyltransferase
MYNISAILPSSSAPANLARVLRVFWTFACTITDTARFNERGDPVDWEFSGLRHFNRLVESPEGAIIVTAHMGNYDLGSYLFARRMKRPITIVRAPEIDPQTQQYESATREKISTDGFRVDYNTDPQLLAIDLVHALRDRHIVAIQGDRVTRGIAAFPVTLFGRPCSVPSGPFALAMATGSLIYPLFVIRTGWKRYRVLTFEPIECRRTGRDRDADLQRAVGAWTEVLERVVREHWQQWFMFDPFDEVTA